MATISRIDIEARREEYLAGLAALQEQVNALMRDITATNGAIQACDYWLALLDERDNKQYLGPRIETKVPNA